MRGRAFHADCRPKNHGVAIVIVLWVVLVLSLLISGFAFTMHVETQVASYARKELKAEMLARSGVEVARMQLILDAQSPTNSGYDALNQDWATNESLYVDHELGDGNFQREGHRRRIKDPDQSGDGHTAQAPVRPVGNGSSGQRCDCRFDFRLDR